MNTVNNITVFQSCCQMLNVQRV